MQIRTLMSTLEESPVAQGLGIGPKLFDVKMTHYFLVMIDDK
jgi:hypothetical protein